MKSYKSTPFEPDSGSPPELAFETSEADRAILMWQPTYAAAFNCIGLDCEDHCCGDWDVPLDKNTFEKYRRFPREKLGELVSKFVILNDPPQPKELYGLIQQTSANCCPFFEADHLCGIQKEYGKHLLSSTCSIYPRSLSIVAERLEGSLSLSCPEAARNVLLTPGFLRGSNDLYSGEFRVDNCYELAGGLHSPNPKPQSIFLPLRNILADVIRDRTRPLWNRLLLVGYLCGVIDGLDPNQSEATLLSMLRRLDYLSNFSPLDHEINDLARDPTLRVATVFALTDVLMSSGVGMRFQDVFWSFAEGIGTPNDAPPGGDIERFLVAERNYHALFFDQFPFILENYLINYMLQNLFPFGRSGSADFISQSVFAEYLQMTTQFAWLNGLLIGIAGHRKADLDAVHVVKAIQSFTREVEHYPEVIQSMNKYMSSRGLNDLKGMAVMLKH